MPSLSVRACAGLIGILALYQASEAADITVVAHNSSGDEVPGTVILAFAAEAEARLPEPEGRTWEVTVSQQDQRFSPAVSVVSVGTDVSFPNFDRMRHHVYSFSEAKRFEVRLYSGEDVPSIRFETPGIVVLGCNIHDWMQAYIFVTDAPYSSVTGVDGIATLTGIPAGEYRFEVWHPEMTESQLVSARIVNDDEQVAINVELDVSNEFLEQQRPLDDPLARLFEERLRTHD